MDPGVADREVAEDPRDDRGEPGPQHPQVRSARARWYAGRARCASTSESADGAGRQRSHDAPAARTRGRSGSPRSRRLGDRGGGGGQSPRSHRRRSRRPQRSPAAAARAGSFRSGCSGSPNRGALRRSGDRASPGVSSCSTPRLSGARSPSDGLIRRPACPPHPNAPRRAPRVVPPPPNARWRAPSRARHGAKELLPLDGEQPGVGERGHRRGPRDVPEQGDLAHVVARPEHRDATSARRHLGLPARDHVKRSPTSPSRDHHLSGKHVGVHRVPRHAFERRGRERFEDRGAAQELEVLGGHARADVHGVDAPPGDEPGDRARRRSTRVHSPPTTVTRRAAMNAPIPSPARYEYSMAP